MVWKLYPSEDLFSASAANSWSRNRWSVWLTCVGALYSRRAIAIIRLYSEERKRKAGDNCRGNHLTFLRLCPDHPQHGQRIEQQPWRPSSRHYRRFCLRRWSKASSFLVHWWWVDSSEWHLSHQEFLSPARFFSSSYDVHMSCRTSSKYLDVLC